MAFPWEVIGKADLAHGHIVEDLKLGLDLAAAGSPPLFCPTAEVRSRFPPSLSGATSQRERWEKGHLGMIAAQAPAYLVAGLRRRDLRLVALALDLSVPPLALLVLLVTGMCLLTAVAAFLGMSLVPLLISAANFAAIVVAIALCWWLCGRDILTAADLPKAVGYVASKIGLYLRARKAGRMSWIRTDRGGGDPRHGS